MVSSTIHAGLPEDTFAAGEQLAKKARPGDVVLLYGGLGAGKTLFVKGFLSGLGYDVDEVTSPSFALVNLYHTETADVYHIDLWRMDEGPSAALAVGLPEILENDHAIVLIEWADRLAKGFTFTNPPLRVVIEGSGDLERSIEITSNGGLE